MRLIWRELAGWLLVVLGLVMAVTCLTLLVHSRSLGGYLLAGSVGVVAITVLLGGSLLLGSLSLELAGWLLVVAGVGVLFKCYDLLVHESRLFEAAPLSIVGIIVFRGGIHLLKVAVAARICSQAREQMRQDAAAKPPPRKPAAAVSGTKATAGRGS
jgi:hypothetical protein